jgi:hypothetical protein
MILCSLDQILKILNCSRFVSKISLKNRLRVDFIKTQFICKMMHTILIRLRVNLIKSGVYL